MNHKYLFLLGILCATTAAAPVAAQTYPAKGIRILVGFAPGGSTDIVARLIAAEMTKNVGQQVVVENRPGAGGNIAAELVSKAPPDGYTLHACTTGVFAIAPFIYSKLPYDPEKGLTPITQTGTLPYIIVMHPSLPAKNVRELIALAKVRPGELNYGSSGIGSLPHLAGEWFALSAGVRLSHVPYKGSGAATIDVMSGEVPVYFMNVLQSLPFIKQGRLRAVGVTGLQRVAIAPDIPTVAESGLTGFDMATWFGILAPVATPRDIILRLYSEIAAILQQKEMRERLAADGMLVVASTPDQFAAFLKSETAEYARVVQAAAIKAQ